MSCSASRSISKTRQRTRSSSSATKAPCCNGLSKSKSTSRPTRSADSNPGPHSRTLRVVLAEPARRSALEAFNLLLALVPLIADRRPLGLHLLGAARDTTAGLLLVPCPLHP